MKKCFLVLLLFSLFVSTSAFGNPLFADVVKMVIRGNLEYYYDSYGNVVVREDVGEAGYLYNNNGEAFACFSSDGNPFSNVAALYYDLDGNYMGKVLLSSSQDIFGQTSKKWTFLDHRNRPVATFVEQTTLDVLAEAGKAEAENDQDAYNAAVLGFLGGALNATETYVLSGRIQRYRN